MRGEANIGSADLWLVPSVSLGVLSANDWIISKQDGVKCITEEPKRIEYRKVKGETSCTNHEK